MTKKILALALAGTTAFSVFAGAMSVNAAAPYAWEDTNAYGAGESFVNIATPHGALGLTSGQVVVANLDAISFEDVTASAFEYDKDKYYVDDWAVLSSTNTAAFKTAIQTEQAKESGQAAVDAYPAYAANSSAAAVTLKDQTDDDWSKAWSKLIGTYTDDVKDYIVSNAVSPAKVAEDYEITDFDAYDAEKLFLAIHTVATTGGTGTTTLSYLTYLNKEYDRIMEVVEEAESVDRSDEYDRLRTRVDMILENLDLDYDDADDKEDIEEWAERAARRAEDGEWDDAIDYLEKILAVEPEKATYTTLRDTLMSLYDNDGKTAASYIKATYPSSGNNYAVYDSSDYRKSGHQSDEWKQAFGTLDTDDKIELDLTRNGLKEKWDSAYELAYRVYTAARNGVRVGQSVVDYANEQLVSAVEALDPTTSSSSWSLMELEATVELGEGFVESDFSTSTKKYKTFTSALKRAQDVLAKSSPAKGEVTSVTTSLQNAIADLKDVSKNVPASLTKELADVKRDAKKLYDDFVSDKVTGTQVVALKNALDAYDDDTYWSAFDIDGEDTKKLISDVEAMIEEFNAAINGFNQAQGWYTNEAGQYMYGEGDSYYVDGWKKIGNFWFFFNEDGTAKQNEWFQDGGSWYYCGNSCVAYSGWGKVNGSWYYFSKSNVMCTGWVRPANSYYYLDPTSGKMVTGWAQIGGKWYYFSTDANTLGAMLVSTTTPDGYQVGADGAMI